MATPLHTVKTEFGSKEALVDALMPQLDRGADESDQDFKERLMRVSNRKLLTLHKREQDLRASFGSRESLVDKIVALQKDADAGMRDRLLSQSTGRLLSMYSGLSKGGGQ